MESHKLSTENERLKARLAEAEETLRAIHNGEVDAVVVTGPKGLQVFTLEGADKPHRLLLEAMNEGALELAPDGTVLYSNARLAKMVGRPLEQVMGSSWQHLFPAREQPLFQSLITQAKEGPDGRSKGESALRTAEGTLRPVQVSISATDLDGVQVLAVLLTDISARKAAEEALRQAKEELEVRVQERTAELAKAKTALEHVNKELEARVQERTAKLNELVAELEHFSYTITHDMRAPLRAMHGFGQILLERSEDWLDPEGQGYLRRIAQSADRMDKLITDALNYSKVVRQELVLEPVNAKALLRGMVESYPEFQPPRAEITIEDNIPAVLGNEAALTQCFSNLLGNAVKFVPPGRVPKVRVWAEAVHDPQPSTIHQPLVRIWFEDNGIGISKDQQQRIWTMFQRVSKHYEGTGIGLALVRKVVERMKGRFGVESESGQGSRFWIELSCVDR